MSKVIAKTLWFAVAGVPVWGGAIWLGAVDGPAGLIGLVLTTFAYGVGVHNGLAGK